MSSVDALSEGGQQESKLASQRTPNTVAAASAQEECSQEQKAEPISLGPLFPGKADRKLIVLVLNREANPKKIAYEIVESLPELANLKTSITGIGTNLVAEISVYVEQETSLSKEFMHQNNFEGKIHFKSDESGVEISPSDVSINLTFDVNPPLWKTEPPSSADASPSESRVGAESARLDMVKAKKAASNLEAWEHAPDTWKLATEEEEKAKNLFAKKEYETSEKSYIEASGRYLKARNESKKKMTAESNKSKRSLKNDLDSMEKQLREIRKRIPGRILK